MKIKHIEMSAFYGGYTKLEIIVDGDKSVIADEVSKVNEAPDKYNLDFKKQSEKRSLDANAYAWVLMDKLAKVLGTDKVSVYKEIVRDVAGVSRIVCVQEKDAEGIEKAWQSRGIGWQTETFPSRLKGCVNMRMYKGSSEFTKEEMSAFLDLIKAECKEQHIETMTPAELQVLKNEYEDSHSD